MGRVPRRLQPVSGTTLLDAAYLQLCWEYESYGVSKAGRRHLSWGRFARAEKSSAVQAAAKVAATELQQYGGTYWSQKNGALRKFEVQSNKLVMTAPGMIYEMLPLGSGQFEALEADSEHRDKYIFHKSSKTGEFDLEAWEGGAPILYSAVKGPLPSPSRLNEYVGSYKNNELEAVWKLVIRDGKLIRQQWMAEDQKLEPAFPDGFIADLSEGQFLMHFNRDAAGKITGFDAATDMVRPMTFTKLEEHIANGTKHVLQ